MTQEIGLAKIVEHFTQLLGPQLQVVQNYTNHSKELDAVIKADVGTIALEYKSLADASSIHRAIAHLRSVNLDKNWIPVLATQHMTSAAKEKCRQAGISWIDLAGNCDIKGKGVFIHVEGRPPVPKLGRPASPFAPKSSRIARWLLIHWDRFLSQREIAHATSMDEGFTSRLVSRLEDLGLIHRNKEGWIKATDPDMLLDAWAEDYDFQKHQIHRYHVAARTGEELLFKTLKEIQAEKAATGLAAAWLIQPFAAFRLATVYLRDYNALAQVRDSLRLREESRGANLWLVLPNDEGVFHGQADHDGVPCVHPVQAWLDLKAHPERSKEAAEQLRATFPWRSKHVR